MRKPTLAPPSDTQPTQPATNRRNVLFGAAAVASAPLLLGVAGCTTGSPASSAPTIPEVPGSAATPAASRD